MIRIQLSGRLGNQLFQLSHGLYLKKSLGEEVYLFYDEFHTKATNGLDLQQVDIDSVKNRRIKKNNGLGLLLKCLDKLRSMNPRVEKSICETFSIKREHNGSTKNPWLVSGYYQDYKYAEYGYSCIQELVDKTAAPQEGSFLSKLPRTYQVIHYRRGDFVGHPNNFGTLAPKYYDQNLLPDLPIIILTDTYSAALNDFAYLRNISVVNPDDVDPWMALKVMSQSQLVIGSNSTLSWWGCYLAVKNGGTAIIPKPFYLNDMNQLLYYPEFKCGDAIFSETLNQ